MALGPGIPIPIRGWRFISVGLVVGPGTSFRSDLSFTSACSRWSREGSRLQTAENFSPFLNSMNLQTLLHNSEWINLFVSEYVVNTIGHMCTNHKPSEKTSGSHIWLTFAKI